MSRTRTSIASVKLARRRNNIEDTRITTRLLPLAGHYVQQTTSDAKVTEISHKICETGRCERTRCKQSVLAVPIA